MLNGVDDIVKTLTEDGVKVVADVEEDVYIKLFATVVAAVVVGAIGFYLVKAVFKG